MSLIKSFDKTNLDLENEKPSGGPISDPKAPFYQDDLPGSKYLDKNPIMGWGRLVETLDKTGLDIESPLPTGGPINSPQHNFYQKDLPDSTYIDKNPIMGNGNLNTDNQFETTNYDLESNQPQGGPINVPSQNLWSNNNVTYGGFSHNWLPNNRYLNASFVTSKEGLLNSSNTFDLTNYDLESNLPAGGPINVPTANLFRYSGVYFDYGNFTHRDLPGDTYLDKFPIQGWESSRLDNEYGIGNIYAYTGLDMTNPSPNSGAPINVPISDGRGSQWGVTEGFVQKWGPGVDKGYLDQDFTKYPFQPKDE